jgi:hypothetical protein
MSTLISLCREINTNLTEVFAMSTLYIRKSHVSVSLFDELIIGVSPKFYEAADATLLYNGAAEEYEDAADYLPRGFGRCTVIA